MLIEKLRLARHPEGGWYRETWRAPALVGKRSAGTAILFLLEAGQKSHWHKVDADELWFWHAGSPLLLSICGDGESPRCTTLGANLLAGEMPQELVPADHWQAAMPVDGWTLVSCTVTPGFTFDGFMLAPEGWTPGGR